MGKGVDELTYQADDVAAEAANFASSLDMSAEAELATAEEDGMPTASQVDSDLEIESDWFDSEPKGESTPISSEADTPDTSDEPSQTIKFKANGEDIELSVEEAQKRLSMAEGARQALQDRSKLRKEAKAKDQEIEALRQYKDTWEKLEAIKHDRQKLLETITGESYDDFLSQEAERREIYQNGTDEQRRLLEQADKIEKLERAQAADSQRREADLNKAETAKFDAEKQRVQNSMEREYYKHKLPEGVEGSAQNKLKNMLWKQSADDLKQYYQKYGKITNKMVEKSFKDNANVLFNSHKQAVAKGVSEVRETKKQAAKEKAQIASVKNSDQGIAPDVLKMNPNQLFDLFRKGK
jgi:hypothetical protein